MTWKEDWAEFKKELTWNNIKALGFVGLFPSLILYGWTFWAHAVTPILDRYSKIQNPTQEESILYLCIVAGYIVPVFFAMPATTFGSWIARVTKLYIDNKTRYVWWDDKYYFVRDMPEEKRKQIEDILSSYKSKTQLRKERLANESWLKRNFS